MSQVWCFRDDAPVDGDYHEVCPHGCDRDYDEVMEDHLRILEREDQNR